MPDIPRLDILLYAHDGRGMGHASRTIAIGLALRRLSPETRVLFISGCKMSQNLIGSGKLDWIKLPSYETVVENGRSRGVRGNSNFEDYEIGWLRAQQIRQIVKVFRPRLVLADHSPLGKHKELRQALTLQNQDDTQWILGMRAVVGNVGQVLSEQAIEAFKHHFRALLWYGDTAVLGRKEKDSIAEIFDTSPVECGYVSRLRELSASVSRPASPAVCTVSIPWIGEKTPVFLKSLHDVLLLKENAAISWRIFLDDTHQDSDRFFRMFNALPNSQITKPGEQYIQSLLQSQSAIVCGGYNSLVDVLSLNLPSIVITRDMQDNEQQYHLKKLLQSAGSGLWVLDEQCPPETLSQSLCSLRSSPPLSPAGIQLNGAEQAAVFLMSILQQDKQDFH